MSNVLYGETSDFRFMVLTAATLTRPATFDTAKLTLGEITTSDAPVTVSTKTDPTVRTYGDPAAGTDLTWAQPRPDQGSYTVSLSGNALPTPAERANMRALLAARGKYIWWERKMHTDTTNEGGCAIVTSTGKPIPADGPVTFSAGLTGYGPLYPDTASIA